MVEAMNQSVDFLRVLFALGFVLGLLYLLNVLVRRYGERFGLPSMPRTAGKDRRLQIIEILPVDPKNKLILIRHDDHEHLLLVGTQNSLTVSERPLKEIA